MLLGYDCGGRRDHYRGRLNHDNRGRWGRSDGFTALSFRALFDGVGASASNNYTSEQYCYAKRQCGGFQSVIHDDHNSLCRFGLA
jgi:hypothetical protein